MQISSKNVDRINWTTLSNFALWISAVMLLFVLIGGRSGMAGDLCLFKIENSYQADLARKVVSHAHGRIDDKFIVEIDSEQKDRLLAVGIGLETIRENVDIQNLYILTEDYSGAALGAPPAGPIYEGQQARIIEAAKAELDDLRADGYMSISLERLNTPIFHIPTVVASSFPTSFPGDTIANYVNIDSLYSYDTRLEDFYTRYISSDSIHVARDWLVTKFMEFGYTNVYTQQFLYDPEYIDCYNVICIKQGTVKPNEIIVVGGHYDSYNTNTAPWIFAPGADDNGSGTATVLELARIFKDVNTDRTIMFVAFSAEEVGLWGSYYLATDMYLNGDDVFFMANYDMVAYTDDAVDDVAIFSGTIPATYNIFAAAAERVTTLLPYYAGYSGGSDHWSFDYYGHPVAYAQEGDFNYPGWHTDLDISTRLDFPYFEQLVRMGAAALMHIDKAASEIEITEIRDVGDGQSLRLIWSPCDPACSYEIYYGAQSGLYTDTISIPGGPCSNDVSGLITGQQYYFAVSAITSDGYGSLYLLENSGTPYLYPSAPENLTATPGYKKITLRWRANREVDLSHYRLLRRPTGQTWQPLLENITDTFYVDTTATGYSGFEYVVLAVDQDGYQSDSSNIAGATAASFDLPMLLADETSGGGMNPTEIQQAAFYDSLFGSWSYDVVNVTYGQLLNRAVAGLYSSIFWIDDDLSNHELQHSIDTLEWYLGFNTNLCVAGFQTVYWVTADNYQYSGDFFYDEFGVRHVMENTDFDFIGAEGQNDWPDLETKTDLFGGLLPNVSVFTDLQPGVEVICTYDSYHDDPLYEGLPCGIMYETSNGKRVALTFPIYHLTEASASALMTRIGAHFGLYSGDPEFDWADAFMDFDSVIMGASDTMTFQVYNSGTNALHLTDFSFSHPDFSVGLTDSIGEPFTASEIPIVFSPSSVGPISSSVTITCDDADEPTFTLALEGVGLEPPVLSLSASSFSEELYSNDTASRTFVLSNLGITDLEYGFRLESNDSLKALAAQCVAGVTMTGEEIVDGELVPVFTEAEEALFKERLEIYRQRVDELIGRYDLPKIGVGGSYANSLMLYLIQDTSLAGRYLFEYTPYSHISEVEDYDGLIIAESDYGLYQNEAEVLNSFYNEGKPIFMGKDDVDSETAAEKELIFPVFGISDAIDGVYYWGQLNPYNPIGSGIDEVFSYADGDNDYFVVDGADWIYAGDDGNYHGVSYSGSARTVLMGENLYRIRIADNHQLIANAIDWMMGGFVRWLSISPRGGTIAYNESREVTLNFDSYQLPEGDYTADLILNTNDPVNAELILPVALHVTSVPDIELADTSINYYSLYIGQFMIDSIEVINEGTEVLSVTDVSIAGDCFYEYIISFNLNPGESKFIPVRFQPSSPGFHEATLSIISNDPNEGERTVTLTGTGVAPPSMSVDVDSLHEMLLVDSSSIREISLHNSGNSDLHIATRVNTYDSLSAMASQCIEGITMSDTVLIDEIPVSAFTESELAAFKGRLETYRQEATAFGQKRDVPSIAVVGSYSYTMLYSLLNHPELSSQYVFVDVYYYSDYPFIAPYDGLIVVENDHGILPDEAQVLSTYYSSGRPIIMGLDDLDDVSTDIQSLVFPIFGISGAVDAVFEGGYLNPNNAITGGIAEIIGYSDTDNDRYTLNGADWIYSDYDGYYHGVSYESNSRTVLMGERLSRIWDYGNDQLIANAIDWMMGRIRWLSIDTHTATIPPGDSAVIGVTFDANGLPGGIYSGDITITGNDFTNPEVLIPVQLRVFETPTTYVSPEPVHYLMKYSTDSLPLEIHIPELATDYSIFDIDTASLTINGTLTPLACEYYTHDPFGECLRIDVLMTDFLDCYPVLWDSCLEGFSLEGQLHDATPLSELHNIMIIGHRAGDVNNDNNVDINDIAYLIDFVYADGGAPAPSGAGNLNCDDWVNMLDIIYLIAYSFRDGPRPDMLCR